MSRILSMGAVPGQVPPRHVHPQDQVTPGQVHTPLGPGTYPPGPGTPPSQQVHPQAGTSPGKVPPVTRYTPCITLFRDIHNFHAGYTPLDRYPPPPQTRYTPGQVHLPGTSLWTRYTPPGPGTPPWVQCMLGDMGNKRAVRILLECILVKNNSEKQRQQIKRSNMDVLEYKIM